VLWILFPLSFYGNLHSTVPRFLVVILPSLLTAQGYLFFKLSQRHGLFKKGMLGAYLILLFVTFGNIYPILEFRHQYALLVDFARWVEKNTESNSQIITADENLFISYYGHRRAVDRPLHQFHIEEGELENFKHTIDKILKQDTPLYIASSGIYAYDPDSQFSNFIRRYYRLEFIGSNLFEDWHRGEIFLRIGKVHLFRLKKK
jgi:hypothetical protein